MGPAAYFILQSRTLYTETLLVLIAALLAVVVIWYLGGRLQTRLGPENAGIARGVLLMVITSLTTVFVVFRWRFTANELSVASVLDLGIDAVVRTLLTFLLFVLAYTLMSILKRLLLASSEEKQHLTSDHQRRAAFYFSQVAIFVGLLLLALLVWNVNLGGLLVGAGVLGIILGFAAQEALGSILAGFILILSRPFDVGDWVMIGDYEGFITEISINNVRLRNLDGEYVVLPNRLVHNQTVINRSREGKLRVRVEVGVDYDVEPERAEQIALRAMEPLNEIMSQPSPEVAPVRFGDSAVILELRFWIENPIPQRRWRARRAVIYAVKQAFVQEEVKIPFPQRELSGRKESGGFRIVNSDPSRQIETGSDASDVIDERTEVR